MEDVVGVAPPRGVRPSHFLLLNGRIADTLPYEAGADTLTFSPFSAGTETRWDAMIAGPNREVRLGLPTLPSSAPLFRGPPLAAPIEVIGTPVVKLRVLPLESGDAVLTAYLREVDATGTIRPITEGTFRLANRHHSDVDAREPWVPRHTFRRADAQPVRIGETTTVSVPLLPIAYRVPKGHRLELVIAGCDTAHFRDVPAPAPGVVLAAAGPERSALILPLNASALAAHPEFSAR